MSSRYNIYDAYSPTPSLIAMANPFSAVGDTLGAYGKSLLQQSQEEKDRAIRNEQLQMAKDRAAFDKAQNLGKAVNSFEQGFTPIQTQRYVGNGKTEQVSKTYQPNMNQIYDALKNPYTQEERTGLGQAFANLSPEDQKTLYRQILAGNPVDADNIQKLGAFVGAADAFNSDYDKAVKTTALGDMSAQKMQEAYEAKQMQTEAMLAAKREQLAMQKAIADMNNATRRDIAETRADKQSTAERKMDEQSKVYGYINRISDPAIKAFLLNPKNYNAARDVYMTAEDGKYKINISPVIDKIKKQIASVNVARVNTPQSDPLGLFSK